MSKIYIKPSKRGSLRKATGTPKGKKIPASKLKIKSTDSPAMRKKKQFAINARKWKHPDGGTVGTDSKKRKPRFSKLDQYIYDRVRPRSYQKPLKRLLSNPENRVQDTPEREELWKYALGSSEELEHWEESPYTPAVSKDKSIKYLRPEYGISKNATMVGQILDKINNEPISKRGKVKNPNASIYEYGSVPGNMHEFDPLGQFKVSRGVDEEGRKYLSVYDKWDLVKPANAILDRNPEIYDRIYYEEVEERPKEFDRFYEIEREIEKDWEIRESGKEGMGADMFKKLALERNNIVRKYGDPFNWDKYRVIPDSEILKNNNKMIQEYDEGGAILGGAAKGLMGGIGLGPLGMLGGAVLGGLQGFLGNKQQEDMLAQQELAQKQANAAASMAGASTSRSLYRPTFAQGGSTDFVPVELENDEIFRRPGSSILEEVDGKYHSQGGEGYVLPVGTEVGGNNINPVTGNMFKRDMMKLKKEQDRILKNVKMPGITGETARMNMKRINNDFNNLFAAQEKMKCGGKIKKRMPKGGTVQEMQGGGLAGILSQSLLPLFNMIPEVTKYGQRPQADPTQYMQGNDFGPGLKAANTAGGLYDPSTAINYDTIPQNMGATLGTNTVVPVSDQQYGLTPWENFKYEAGNVNWGGLANTAAQLSPMIYNFAQGMRPAEQLTDVAYKNPEYNNAINLMANRRYDIEPMLDANRSAAANLRYNLKNQGASAGQLYSGLQGAAINRMRSDAQAWAQKNNMENQYLAQEAQARMGLGSEWAQTKLGVANMNEANRAARRSHLGQGFADLSEWAQMRTLMENQKGRDKDLLELYPDMFAQMLPYMQGAQNIIAKYKVR